MALSVADNYRIYYYIEENMHFKVTFTLRAATVKKWIRHVKEEFLDGAPVKCVGLDSEFTDAPLHVR